jgi:phosphonate transport system substrate-binding protein
LPFISLQPDSGQESAENGTAQREILRLAVAGPGSPQLAADYYSPLIEYLQQRLNLPIQLVARSSYTEINDLVSSGTVHLAFISTYSYILMEQDFGVELFVAPVIDEVADCSSCIIVRKDSGTLTFEGLRGKSFAFTDPLSTTGTLYPKYLLSAVGQTPASFFGSYTFTFGSDNSIRAVAGRLVDGAAVNSLVYNHLLEHSPELVKDIAVIHRSRPFSPNPAVVSKSLDITLKENLRSILITMHESEQGKNILADLGLKRFIPKLETAYDEIRAMAKAVGGAP